MRPDEEPKVRAIYREAHPGWPERSPLWYFAHPTLVMQSDGALLGFTSYSIGHDDRGLVIFGVDVAVLPRFQHQGYGRQLADERLRYGRDVGCTRFLGATQPDNLPMLTILERQGFTQLPLRVPNVFPHGTDAILIGGEIA
jgi:GNAT superfamily N-acetyltransferase